MMFFDRSRKTVFGIFTRKSRWGLSRLGWLLVLLAACLLSVFLFRNVEPFLAETRRVPADTLVVEGWIHEYAIRAAVEEFRKGSYRRVFTTGGPVVGNGGYINDYQTSASVGADLLKKNGLSNNLLNIVPSRVSDRDRTYASAVALREWFSTHMINVRSLNVVTESTHARRTRLMFERAFGKDVAIGVIAVANPDYNERRWWRYSEGVKEVSSEALAYVYTILLFRPSGSRTAQDSKTVSANSSVRPQAHCSHRPVTDPLQYIVRSVNGRHHRGYTNCRSDPFLSLLINP